MVLVARSGRLLILGLLPSMLGPDGLRPAERLLRAPCSLSCARKCRNLYHAKLSHGNLVRRMWLVKNSRLASGGTGCGLPQHLIRTRHFAGKALQTEYIRPVGSSALQRAWPPG